MGHQPGVGTDEAVLRKRAQFARTCTVCPASKFPVTIEEKRIIKAFDGNPVSTARTLGIKPDVVRKAIAIPQIAEKIRTRHDNIYNKPAIMETAVATRQERQKFWTDLMHDVTAAMGDRIKASELLGKSEGDFLDRVEHTGQTQSIIQIVPVGFQPTGLLSANPITARTLDTPKQALLPEQKSLSELQEELEYAR
jgi:phage terminase small subunit